MLKFILYFYLTGSLLAFISMIIVLWELRKVMEKKDIFDVLIVFPVITLLFSWFALFKYIEHYFSEDFKETRKYKKLLKEVEHGTRN